uniref:hypothetical protein n=1 Tax=Neorhizobium sp. EC2-8 TaxID=3129230 RepID=UPI003101B222
MGTLCVYDGYGNRTAHVNSGTGSRTEWDYDAAYHLYPVTERAPKYFATGGQPADARFVSSFTNDVVCGKPATKVDWNGVTETFTYDPFCRPYGYTNAGTGNYINTRYENEGNPASQAVVTYQASSSWGADVFTRTQYDGVGRPWRVQMPGETVGGQTRITDTSYDARGNVWQTAFPRFANETAQWTVNSYDWQDRVVKTVNPDGSAKTFYHYIHVWIAISGTTNIPLLESRNGTNSVFWIGGYMMVKDWRSASWLARQRAIPSTSSHVRMMRWVDCSGFGTTQVGHGPIPMISPAIGCRQAILIWGTGPICMTEPIGCRSSEMLGAFRRTWTTTRWGDC